MPKLREIIKVAQEPLSLETPIGKEEDSRLGDFIEDREAEAPATTVAHELLREDLTEVLSALRGAGLRVSATAEEVLAMTSSSQQGATEQAASVQQTSTNTEELARTIRPVLEAK